MRQHCYRYLMVTLGCVPMGVAINAFYMPNKLISGGIGGVSVILYYLIGLPMGITSLLLNIPLFIAAYKFMDRSYIVVALYSMLVFPFPSMPFTFWLNRHLMCTTPCWPASPAASSTVSAQR